jgi:hypothetical protein
MSWHIIYHAMPCHIISITAARSCYMFYLVFIRSPPDEYVWLHYRNKLHVPELFFRICSSRSWLRNSPTFVKPEGFITVLATKPYLEPNESIFHSAHYFLRFILISFSHLRSGLASGLLHSGFPTNTFHAFFNFHMRVTCPVHPIFLDLITLIVTYVVKITNYETRHYAV